MEGGGLGAAVEDADPDEEVFGGRLGVLDEDVEVTIVVKDAGVDQLVLWLRAAPRGVRRYEVVVGVRSVRVLVEVPHVRVRGGAVEVVVILLDVLAVVPFAVGEAEEALLEDRVVSVPERKCEAELLPVVGDAGEAVLAAAVGTRAGLVVGEVVPGVAGFAVVLADGRS